MLLRVAGLLMVALLSGCSSMSESECLTADWELIGRVDGSKGVHPEVLNEYREDCAEYAVVPQQAEYFAGHEQGLKQFCTRSSGFYAGKRGYKYQGVCQAEAEREFLEGYRPGYELFMLEEAVTTLRNGVSDAEREIRHLRRTIQEKEHELIKDGKTESQRKQLMKEIRGYHNEIFWLNQDLQDNRFRLLDRESELWRKNRQYQP